MRDFFVFRYRGMELLLNDDTQLVAITELIKNEKDFIVSWREHDKQYSLVLNAKELKTKLKANKFRLNRVFT